MNTSGALLVASKVIASNVVEPKGGTIRRVGAIKLDGKITRDEIFVDLTERVAALTAAGRTPRLGTVLVGDDRARTPMCAENLRLRQRSASRRFAAICPPMSARPSSMTLSMS